MIIEACMLFFGISIDFDKINTDTVSKLNTGVIVTLKQDNLSISFENRYYIKEFKKKALGFSLSDSLYTFDAKYLLSENKDTFQKISIGFEHQCKHLIDNAPSLDNMKEFGVSNKFYIMETK